MLSAQSFVLTEPLGDLGQPITIIMRVWCCDLWIAVCVGVRSGQTLSEDKTAKIKIGYYLGRKWGNGK